MREEWSENFLPEIKSSIAAEFQRTKRTSASDLLPVMPWTHDKKYLVVGRIFRLERLVGGGSAVNVFLVPQAIDEHHRHLQRLRRENAVHRLLLPERVVARMLQNLPPEADLLEPVATSELAR